VAATTALTHAAATKAAAVGYGDDTFGCGQPVGYDDTFGYDNTFGYDDAFGAQDDDFGAVGSLFGSTRHALVCIVYLKKTRNSRDPKVLAKRARCRAYLATVQGSKGSGFFRLATKAIEKARVNGTADLVGCPPPL
jgi:hypothetical protein